MDTTSPLSQEVWERTPAEAQAYIRALEARVAALETTVPSLLERLRMDSRNSSQPPSNDPPATRSPRPRRPLGVRTAQRHIFLDNEIDSRKISQQLYRLAALARESGSAIGTGHPYRETVQSFCDTLPEIQQTGVEFVPISRLVQ